MPPSFDFFKRILRKKRDASICFVGLDRAGKSTIVYRLRTGQFVEDLSRTLGLNIDDLSVGKFNLKTFDLGGQTTFRESIWEPYVQMVSGICFVIDSMDRERYPLAMQELYRTVKMTKMRIPLLVLLNKVDLIEDQLQLQGIGNEKSLKMPLEIELKQFIGGFLHCLDTDFITHHTSNFLVLGASAKTGEGLKVAFEDFFANQIERYIDLLESEHGEAILAKEPEAANMIPTIKDYIPFVHPKLVLVARDNAILISAKPQSLDVEIKKLESEFVRTFLRETEVSYEAIRSGTFESWHFLILQQNKFSIALFADINDPILAIKDFAQEIVNFLTEKDAFSGFDVEYKKIQEDLEQFLQERYDSIPPIL
ncbi:MAG: ADP-ribosylation factor-like protein [Candidatus Hodarchaeales archaeon]